MMCARCDKPIKDGEPFEQVDNLGASGGGDVSYRHRHGCRRAQLQTGPMHITQLPPYRPGSGRRR